MQGAYKYFWLPIPLLLIIGLVRGGTLDFQLQHNYLVIGTIHFCGILSFFFLISGLAYFLLRKRQFNWTLTVCHLGMTSIALISLVMNLIYFPEEIQKAMQALTLFLMFLIGGFLCYVVNILWTLIMER